MIFDAPKSNEFLMYKSRSGPFCLIFYQEKNNQNKELYIYLKWILKQFHYLPFVRFHFENFKDAFPEQKITSANQILIIEMGKENITEDLSDFSKIPAILQTVKTSLLPKKKQDDSYCRNRNRLITWAPNFPKIKISTFLKLDEKDKYTMFEFPNKTAQLPISKRRNRRQASNLRQPLCLSKSEKISKNHVKLIN